MVSRSGVEIESEQDSQYLFDERLIDANVGLQNTDRGTLMYELIANVVIVLRLDEQVWIYRRHLLPDEVDNVAPIREERRQLLIAELVGGKEISTMNDKFLQCDLKCAIQKDKGMAILGLEWLSADDIDRGHRFN
jgi:hypothetical protein